MSSPAPVQVILTALKAGINRYPQHIMPLRLYSSLLSLQVILPNPYLYSRSSTPISITVHSPLAAPAPIKLSKQEFKRYSHLTTPRFSCSSAPTKIFPSFNGNI
jgi:hypothetical protein